MSDPQSQPSVTPLGPPVAIPVFNCRVLVGPRDAAGNVTARAAEIADLSITAASEREALQKLVAEFKSRMKAIAAAGQPIPWIKPGETATPGEKELFIAVHL